MGYYSTVRGSLDFDPPATGAEIPKGTTWFEPLVIKTKQEHEDGYIIRLEASSIGVRFDDSGKAYDVVNELQEIVEALPCRTWSGYFRIEGEEPGDLSRLHVINDKVVQERAVVTWPDGSDAAY